MRGEFGAARELIDRAIALARELGDQIALARALGDSARVEMLASSTDGAPRRRRGRTTRSSSGWATRATSPARLRTSATSCTRRGATTRRTSSPSSPNGSRSKGTSTPRCGGASCARRCLPDGVGTTEAERLAMAALRIVAPTDYLDLHADACSTRSRRCCGWRAGTRTPPMRSAKAIALRRRKGNLVATARAEQMLADLDD